MKQVQCVGRIRSF